MVMYNFKFVFITDAVGSYLKPAELYQKSLLSSSQTWRWGVDGPWGEKKMELNQDK